MLSNPLSFLPTNNLEPESCILIVLDAGFVLRHINRQGAEMLGYTVADMLHRDWFDHFLLPEEGKRLKDLLSRLLRTNPKRIERFENAVLKANGEQVVVRWHNQLVYDADKRIVGSLSTGHADAHTQPQLPVPSREALAIKKMAVSACIEAHEKERRIVAQTLHEQTSQVLAMCKLLIEGEQLKTQSPNLDKAGKYLQSVIDQLRLLTHRFNPEQLAMLGLEHAIRELLLDLLPEELIHTQVKINNRKALKSVPPDIQLSLFRIIQEQAANIREHAGASQAQITLNVSPDLVELEIRDNGQGFDTRLQPPSCGLNSMRLRAENHGGWLHLNAEPGKGCRVLVYLPLNDI